MPDLSEGICYVPAVEHSNFYDYHVPRMKDVPPMHIEVIQTDNHPSGAGGRPLVAPAIAAAVAELTGVLRHTPFLPERVKKALGLNRHLSPWAGREEPSSEAIG